MKKAIAFLFLPLLVGLFYIQVFSHRHFQRLSERNAIRTIHMDIPRGQILDRNGVVLAEDRVAFNLTFIPFDLDTPGRYAEILSPALDVSVSELHQKLSARKANPFEPGILHRDLTREQLHFIEENINRLPGFSVQAGLRRHYPLGKVTAAIIGYLGEVSRSELELVKHQQVRMGDLVGKYGLERTQCQILRGQRGGTQVEVDARGRHLRVLGEKDSRPGHTVVTTIDSRLQQAAYQHLGDRAGSVVVIDTESGEVLALASRPVFDPDQPAAYLGQPGTPFINRAIAGQYPPGSAFKIITALAGLETGAIKTIHSPDPDILSAITDTAILQKVVPRDVYECTGSIEIGERTFHCWREEGHGWVGFKEAMARSCNIYFGQTGMQLGERRLLETARQAGLGNATGIDLPGEKPGLIPRPGLSGGALNLSIGQGALLTTPLQLCNLMATIANNGNILTPHVVQEVKSRDGIRVHKTEPSLQRFFFVAPSSLETLKDALEEVVVSGTGRAAAVPGARVAGKTGTAQIAHRELEMYSRANFIGYLRTRQQSLAIAVVLDQAVWGAEAALVAGNILREYLAPDLSESFPAEELLPPEETADPEATGQQPYFPDYR